MTDTSALFDLDRYRSSHPHAGRAAPRAPRPRQAEQWPLDDGINVVLFAGLGGACQGLERAGLPVHVAVNHDPVAIAASRGAWPNYSAG